MMRILMRVQTTCMPVIAYSAPMGLALAGASIDAPLASLVRICFTFVHDASYPRLYATAATWAQPGLTSPAGWSAASLTWRNPLALTYVPDCSAHAAAG